MINGFTYFRCEQLNFCAKGNERHVQILGIKLPLNFI